MPDTIDDVDEHPIIFNDWSIHRIFAGEKTQTRRIVKPQPPHNEVHGPEMYTPAKVGPGGKITPGGDHYGVYGPHGEWGVKCPYGQPGDVLWVREGFQFPEFEDDVSPRDLVDYWVGEAGAPPPVKYSTGETKRAWNGHDWGRKRPSIHMPRELCRLRLRVEDVRVERVQSITKEDAEAEGVASMLDDVSPYEMTKTTCIEAFQHKWNDIHGDGAWGRNEWVWVIEFARYDE